MPETTSRHPRCSSSTAILGVDGQLIRLCTWIPFFECSREQRQRHCEYLSISISQAVSIQWYPPRFWTKLAVIPRLSGASFCSFVKRILRYFPELIKGPETFVVLYAFPGVSVYSVRIFVVFRSASINYPHHRTVRHRLDFYHLAEAPKIDYTCSHWMCASQTRSKWNPESRVV